MDVATLRRLQFWELQNACLVLSLVGAVFGCYLGLRWATACPRPVAFFLAAVYGLSPALLCLTHSLNLFMTVHAAVFVPLAIAACVRGCRMPSLSTDLFMAAALALAWLAHPPVALWLTWGVMLVRIVAFACAPGWRPVARAAAAAVLGILLAGFAFASVGTLNSDLKYFSAAPGAWADFARIILSNLKLALPGVLLPVSRIGNGFNDLQFGYVAWALLALTIVLVVRARGRRADAGGPERIAAAGACLTAFLLLFLTFPVPGITYWLWRHMPLPVLEMTFLWPMQRLYLVALGFTVFGAALMIPAGWQGLVARRWVASALVAGALAWTLYEAVPLVSIGFVNRRTADATLAAFRPSNLELTETSYAYVGESPTFINGADDPRFDYRLLKGGRDEAASNYTEALSNAPVVNKGSILISPSGHGAVVGSREIVLMPGHRYLISFAFRTPPFKGWVEFVGPFLRRSYSLPSAGAPLGFGMLEGQRRALSLSTDSDQPERVKVTIGVDDGGSLEGRQADVADYTLQDVPMDKLPVRQDGYLPLKLEVNAAQPGSTVETPQRYLKGYAATVNGRPVPVLMSPWRNVMVGVPAGRSVVEIFYEGPRFARQAFWLSAAFWAAFLAWLLGRVVVPARAVRAGCAAILAFFALVWRLRLLCALAAVIAAAFLYCHWRFARRQANLGAVGPIEVRFQLPYGATGTSQPLVATGHPQAGAIVFVTLLDEHHVRLGADVWGSVYRSEPIELDFSAMHTLVVSDSAFFPRDNDLVKALQPQEVKHLRDELRIELDGAVAIDANCYAYDATPSEIYVGHTPFGSTSLPDFAGTIVDSRRLPIPRLVGMPWGGRAHLRLRFPSDRMGATESLLTFNSGTGTIEYTVTYAGTNLLRFSSTAAGGKVTQSAEVQVDLAKTHSINFWPSVPRDPREPYDISCDLDGKHILGGDKPLVLPVCPLVSSGVGLSALPSDENRFSGPELNLTLTSDGTSTGSIEEYGAAHMIVTLPSMKTGRHEPILTTGRSGAGDLIYVVYEDERHIRIGFDHWGVGGTLSAPFEVDYKAPHDIWVTEGALYPAPGDSALWGAVDPATRQRLKTLVAVVFDGKTVLSEESPNYPSTKGEVTFTKNPIGGSTADPEFSGILHYSERTGSVLPPSLRL